MPASKGRALVTGGAGLIGSHLVDLLISQGYDVTILDNLDPQTHPQGKPKWVHSDARFIEGDVRSKEDFARALKGCRFVLHQAAFGGFTDQILKYVDVNTGGTACLFELLGTGKFQVEKVVVASSQAVYGEGAYQCVQHKAQFPKLRSLEQLRAKQWELKCPECRSELRSTPVSEDKPFGGETPYALSKEFEEKIAFAQGRRLKIPVVALRYALTYGPRQSLFNPYTGVISIFSKNLLNEKAPFIYEDGSQTRDFIYAGDAARANLFALEHPETDFQAFNVSSGKPVTILDLAARLERIYEKKRQSKITRDSRWGEARHMILNPGKFARLGFRVSVSLEQGLKNFADWIQPQKMKEPLTRAYSGKKKLIAVS